jgi:hypothetical protein
MSSFCLAQRAFILMLVLFFIASGSSSGQSKGPARVFKPALKQIQSQARIPIVLPSKLPATISEKSIKKVWGEVRKDGYFISLYFTEDGMASYAAGFGGSTQIFGPDDIGNTHQVGLSGGRKGMFRPVSCGGSCAPANLWWVQNGVMYQIQIQGGGTEAEQERVLVETANSSVTVSRK